MNVYEVTQTTFKKVYKSTASMAWCNLTSLVHWSPFIKFVILATGVLCSFLIALERGDVNANLPFISETGAFSPEQCLFSLSLILGSFIGCVFMIFRYLIMADNPLTDKISFVRMNKVSLAAGLFSMLGLAGVAAFPMTTVFAAHLAAAGIYFAGSAIYMILCTIMTLQVDGRTRIYNFRMTLTVIIFVFEAITIFVFPIALTNWKKNNDIIPALKTPEDKGFSLLLFSSILEWLIVVTIIAYHLSLITDLKKYKLCLKAEKTEPDEIAGTVAEVPVNPV